MRYLNVSLRPSLPFGLLQSLRVQGFNTRRAPVHAITVGDEPQARQAYDLNGSRAKSCGISVPRPILSGGAGERARARRRSGLCMRPLPSDPRIFASGAPPKLIGRYGALLPLFRLVGALCIAAFWRVKSLPRHRGDRPKLAD